MQIDLQVTNHATPKLRRLLRKQLPNRRRTAVEQTARDALTDTIRLNPVDTARSRAAWVAALEQLGGTPPAGWQGEAPVGEVTAGGEGHAESRQDRDTSLVTATNSVPYIPFLEYGTSRMSPFAMVRRSLLRARLRLLQRLRRLIH